MPGRHSKWVPSLAFLAGDFRGTDTPRRRVRMAREEPGGMQKSLLCYLDCNPFPSPIYSFIYFVFGQMGSHCSVHVELRGLAGVDPLLPSRGFQGLNSAYQPWLQTISQ